MLPTAAQATRGHALDHMHRWVPRAGQYAKTRNYDVENHENVSRLSPYLRTRLLHERDVIDAVLSRYSTSTVEKFVQEVLWRTYWKGWLQMRPLVWADYRVAVRQELEALAGAQRDVYERACNGTTGIDCFDHWARELNTTGYLHNHARMWFASIWVFTLNLPWALGADYFLRTLLDGDPASNTLSWRWVAGLQTKGKHYVARASNIAKYTEGRFQPDGQLNERPAPLHETASYERRPIAPPPSLPEGRLGLLIHSDDCLAEEGPLAHAAFDTVAGGWRNAVARSMQYADHVAQFRIRALGDAVGRAERHFQRPAPPLDPNDWQEGALEWACRHDLDAVVCLEAPVGPWQEALAALLPCLSGRGIALIQIRRSWDETLWPLATAGFFGFWKKAQRPLKHAL